jgi:hypothetical protein
MKDKTCKYDVFFPFNIKVNPNISKFSSIEQYLVDLKLLQDEIVTRRPHNNTKLALMESPDKGNQVQPAGTRLDNSLTENSMKSLLFWYYC